MERLTERFSNGQAAVRGCGKNCKWDFKYCDHNEGNCPTLGDIYEKLANYEEMEEQGLIHIPTEKDKLIEYVDNADTADWFNPFYVMAYTFSKEDILDMSDETVEMCLKVAKTVSDFLDDDEDDWWGD